MAALREAFSTGGDRDREQAVRDVARALGYRRVGDTIAATLDSALVAGVRRGILKNERGRLSLLCRSIEEYTLDHLVSMLVAEMGTGWWDRADLIRGSARYLGFRRTGDRISQAFKSAMNAAIGRGLLEAAGQRVRKRA